MHLTFTAAQIFDGEFVADGIRAALVGLISCLKKVLTDVCFASSFSVIFFFHSMFHFY